MRMEKTGRKERFLIAGLAVGIIMFFVMICAVNLFHYNYRMNSDIASEALLGKEIWERGQLLPDTWYSSTEARVISTPNLAALFYGMTKDMALSMGLSCCCMTALILFSISFFCRQAGIGPGRSLLMVFLSLALPADFNFLELVYLFAGYYGIQTAVFFFTLGVYADALKTRKIKYVRAGISILFALLLGFQGARGILVIYIPLLAVEFLRGLCSLCGKQKKSKTDMLIGAWTALLLAVSFWGNSFSFSVEQEFSRNIRNGFHKLIITVIPDMLNIVGLWDGMTVGKICLGVFAACAVIRMLIILWHLLKVTAGAVWGVKPEEWICLVIGASPIITAFAVAFTTIESAERYYFMLIYAMAFGAVLLSQREGCRWGLGILTATLAVLHIYQVYCPVFCAKEPPETESLQVVRFLEENNYSMAYATFENANSMTLISNGRVQVAPVASTARMDICKWLSSSEWYVPVQPYHSMTAYVITENEMEEFRQFLKEKEETVSKAGQIGKFNIYVSEYNYSNGAP